MSKLSQKDRVLCHLHEHGEITSWEAIKEYGITRISAVIFNLRKEGWYIENEWIHTKNRYGDDVKYVNYKLIKTAMKLIKENENIKQPFVSCEEIKINKLKGEN